MHGDMIVALSVVVYAVFLTALWWLTRGNAPVVVAVAYLIGPAPADNILTQVFIFPTTDFSLRSRDLFFLADIVLVLALLLTRPPLPVSRLVRWWVLGLLALAVYPVVVGLLFGSGQSTLALLQGATMPLRGAGLVLLIAGWAATHGWASTLGNLARTLVACGALLAWGVLVAVVLAHGELRYSLFNYPLMVDGRPSLPGWGNNILANFFCVCLAIVVFLRPRLGWSLRWLVPISLLLLAGLLYTEVRIAMMLALVIVEVPLVLAVLRRVWPRRGAWRAVLSAVLAALVLGLVTVTILPIANPRFQTLTPRFIAEQVSNPDENGDRSETMVSGSGVDLGGDSFGTRTGLLRTAGKIWLRDPVAGVGWNAWGWAKSEQSRRLVVAIDPHNGLVWLLAEAGVLGLALLYWLPFVMALRRLHLWWLWAVPLVATALELINPNLRDGHFAVAVWTFFALGTAAGLDRADPPGRYTIRRWISDAGQWVQGKPLQSSPPTGAVTSADASDDPSVSHRVRSERPFESVVTISQGALP